MGGMIDMSPPRVVENRNLMKQVYGEMLADTEEGGYFCRPIEKIGASTASATVISGDQQVPGLKAADNNLPKAPTDQATPSPTTRELVVSGNADSTLVAIADFVPPPTHQTQMLKLCVGEAITVLGQDGRGWWYGQKDNGKEGWFPPSYVQVKPAHFMAEPVAPT